MRDGHFDDRRLEEAAAVELLERIATALQIPAEDIGDAGVLTLTDDGLLEAWRELSTDDRSTVAALISVLRRASAPD